jgi:hypothetical protein
MPLRPDGARKGVARKRSGGIVVEAERSTTTSALSGCRLGRLARAREADTDFAYAGTSDTWPSFER